MLSQHLLAHLRFRLLLQVPIPFRVAVECLSTVCMRLYATYRSPTYPKNWASLTSSVTGIDFINLLAVGRCGFREFASLG
ncbi:hypothetical protein M758_3G086100 [Ceratodon purpureus]|nr:hypothetical protein M758_3G086100 [Ceratodon purpureus]